MSSTQQSSMENLSDCTVGYINFGDEELPTFPVVTDEGLVGHGGWSIYPAVKKTKITEQSGTLSCHTLLPRGSDSFDPRLVDWFTDALLSREEQRGQQYAACNSLPPGFRYNDVTRSYSSGQADAAPQYPPQADYQYGAHAHRRSMKFWQAATQLENHHYYQFEPVAAEYGFQNSCSADNGNFCDIVVGCAGVNASIVHHRSALELQQEGPPSLQYPVDPDRFARLPPRTPSSGGLNEGGADVSTSAASSNFGHPPSWRSVTSVEEQQFSVGVKAVQATDENRDSASKGSRPRGDAGKELASAGPSIADDDDYRCQNDSCGTSLANEKAYCQRYRLCKHCIGLPSLILDGEEKRFCQQCSLLHSITEFDTVKKSCRTKLAMHALRLRERRAAKRSMRHAQHGK